MKVMIDIPKEFEEDLKDNFQDFFNRMIADITYSLNDEELMCCGNYERETAEMFLSAFEKATVIPDDAEDKSISLEKVKKAREEIRKLDDINPDYPMDRTIHVSRNEVLKIIDKLIESEEKE